MSRCFDFSHWHKGHSRTICIHGGTALVVCLDCGVAGEIESISAKISPADSQLLEVAAKDREAIGQISQDLNFRGVTK